MECVCCGSKDTGKFLSLDQDAQTRSSWGAPYASQTILVCRHCGVQFSDRIQSGEEPDYEQEYQDLMTGNADASEAESGIHEQSEFRMRMIMEYHQKGDLLDVGCSTGAFLEKAKQHGFSIHGLDPSAYACEQSRLRLEIGSDCIIHSSIQDAAILQEKKFDVITVWDVIEHCQSPRENLLRLVDALKPGGIIVIRTPDTSSIFFQSAILLSRLSFGMVLFPLLALYHSDHFVLFNRKSLSHLFSRVGLAEQRMVADPLLWKRFKYCECRRGAVVNLAISLMYCTGKMFGYGHGLIGIGRK